MKPRRESHAVIYRATRIEPEDERTGDLDFKLWRPRWNSMLPPGKSRRYLAYALFHAASVFRNPLYSAMLVYGNGQLVSSHLVVPAHFKWPFMGRRDVQFTYVQTSPDYRGRGLAERAIRRSAAWLGSEVDAFWYVTDEANLSSIALCTKLGFTLVASGRRQGPLRILNPV